MNILNFGSMNIDKVYMVKNIVEKGETILTNNYDVFLGGKGLNQSIALQRAGCTVYHAGLIGNDGQGLIDYLRDNQVNCDLIKTVDDVCGHAIIQVNDQGQNAIIVYGGSNQKIDQAYIDAVLDQTKDCEWIIVQNEISNLDYLLKRAKQAGRKIALNPSPITDALFECALENVDLFIVNQIEAKALSDQEAIHAILKSFSVRYPKAQVVLTLGENGSIFQSETQHLTQKAYSVTAVDTTAAGDTFTGYFLANYLGGKTVKESLDLASAASAMSVMIKGASNSIPCADQVTQWIATRHD